MLGNDPESAFLGRVRAVGATLAASRLHSSDWGLLTEGGGIWSRVLSHLTLTPSENDDWYRIGGAGAPATDWLLERVVAKEAARSLLSASGLKFASADLTVNEHHGEATAWAPDLGRGDLRLRIGRRGGWFVASASTGGGPAPRGRSRDSVARARLPRPIRDLSGVEP